MKVDSTAARDVLEEYAFITGEMMRLGQDIPWDLPPNVLKCRNIYYDRLEKKLMAIVESEEGVEYKLKRNKHLF